MYQSMGAMDLFTNGEFPDAGPPSIFLVFSAGPPRRLSKLVAPTTSGPLSQFSLVLHVSERKLLKRTQPELNGPELDLPLLSPELSVFFQIRIARKAGMRHRADNGWNRASEECTWS